MKRTILILAGLAMMAIPAAAQSAKLNVCTGGSTGNYYLTASEIGSQLKGLVDVNVVETNGSMDNLHKMASGECDAAVVQSDAYGIFTASNPSVRLEFERVVPLYNEYVHFVCNRDADIHSVRDLIGNDKRVMIGPNGSGTAVTWQTWARHSEEYLKVGTDTVGGSRAITKAIDGTENQCLLFVAGLGSGTMMKVNELGKGKLALVSVDDGSFDDVMDPKGQRVYEFRDIPADSYPNLQNFGWLGSGKSVPTLTIQAVLIANTDWIDKNPRAYESFADASIRWSQQNTR